jgi:acetyl esterase
VTIDSDIAELLRSLPSTQPASLEELRVETDRGLLAMQGALEPVERVENIHPDGLVRMRAYWPVTEQRGGRLPAVVFAHAGGWCLVSLDTYDNPCCALANATGCVVVSVDYRLAPEYPYPAPLEDFYRAVSWVADHADQLGIDPSRIVVAGDSAGGNLAAGVALLSRDRKGPAIAHQLLMYPPLDVDFNTPSYGEFAEGYYLTRDAMKFCWQAYLGDQLSRPPIYAAPLRADLGGLPPATILVNEFDPLLSEGEAFAQRLEEAGVSTKLVRLEGMIHACIHMLGIASAARSLFVHAGREIRHQFGLQPT